MILSLATIVVATVVFRICIEEAVRSMDEYKRCSESVVRVNNNIEEVIRKINNF